MRHSYLIYLRCLFYFYFVYPISSIVIFAFFIPPTAYCLLPTGVSVHFAAKTKLFMIIITIIHVVIVINYKEIQIFVSKNVLYCVFLCGLPWFWIMTDTDHIELYICGVLILPKTSKIWNKMFELKWVCWVFIFAIMKLDPVDSRQWQMQVK